VRSRDESGPPAVATGREHGGAHRGREPARDFREEGLVDPGGELSPAAVAVTPVTRWSIIAGTTPAIRRSPMPASCRPATTAFTRGNL
jgi:hypothetical protein